MILLRSLLFGFGFVLLSICLPPIARDSFVTQHISANDYACMIGLIVGAGMVRGSFEKESP